MIERNLESDVKLDKYDLDGQAESQASIYAYWGKEASRAGAARDRAELEYKIRRAEVASYFRSNPPKDVKVTNDTVDAYCDTASDVVKLKRDWIEAEERATELDHALRALQMKRDAISDLVKLHLNNYFSRPGGASKADNSADGFRSGLGRRQPAES